MDRVREAVKVLLHDGLVVYPTDTIYGLGADAFSEEAILRVFEAKQRPLGNPISIAVSDPEMIHGVARVDRAAEFLIDSLLPGPVTLVLPAKRTVSGLLTGGTKMIGIRYPCHPVALELISCLDSPITATSANISGAKDPVTPDECNVPYDFLIDEGKLQGTPSTVVDTVSRKVIRAGVQIDEVLALLSALDESTS
ncbi:MAG: threonylcarbamoyl-AMP synthase [Methanoregulaceae archaeon]|nr:threonylcarbamoyl-AMP synthase [Methanoregulaceae archaeon]